MLEFVWDDPDVPIADFGSRVLGISVGQIGMFHTNGKNKVVATKLPKRLAGARILGKLRALTTEDFASQNTEKTKWSDADTTVIFAAVTQDDGTFADFKGNSAKVKALVASLNKMVRDVPVDTDTVGRKLSNMKRSLTGKDGDAKRVKLEAEAKKLQA